MKRRVVDLVNVHCYSNHASMKLKALRPACAAMEMPSGYGKIPALRGRFCNVLSQETRLFWFTGVDNLYRGHCQEPGGVLKRPDCCSFFTITGAPEKERLFLTSETS